MQPFLEMYQRIRRDGGWRASADLPEVPSSHPRAAVWGARSILFWAGLSVVEEQLGGGPWRALEVGAGCCWASLRLLERGHQAAAVDVNMDPEDGLLAANRFLTDPAALPRAEAEMEALPLEAGNCDLLLAVGSLHHAARLTRTLVEMRRVTRRGGVLLVLDSPVFRHRPDGEAMVADRMKQQQDRYGFVLPREHQSSYFVLEELRQLFRTAGWNLDMHLWPGHAREWGRDALDLLRRRRRLARFPILVARRDG